jgi:hypothetical protein
MIRFFKSSFVVQYFAICITALILWGRSFFEPPPMPLPDGFVPFYSFLYSLLSGFALIQVIAGYLLVIVSAIILNRLLYTHNIVQKNTSMTGFVFVILMSYYPELQTIQPVNIAVFFLLLILTYLLGSYNREEPLDFIYSAGFIITIGSYVYFPFIFFYGLILFSFIFFRSVKWREWVSSVFGLLTPFLFLATYYFWFDLLLLKIHEYLGMFTIHADFMPFKKPVYIILSSFITLLSIYTLSYGLTNRIEKTIERKRKNLLLNWVIFFVLVSYPFTSKLTGYHLQLAFIAFSGSLAFYLMQIRKPFWQELLLLLFILFLLTNNLFFRWY